MAHLQERVQELESSLAALREEEQRLRSVLSALPFDVSVVDGGGRIQFGNRGLFGLTESDCVGRSISELSSGRTDGAPREALDRAQSLGQPVWLESDRADHPAGERPQVVEFGVAPLGSGAEPSRLVVTCRDVTQRRRVEQHLAHGRRMDAVGRLADGVAQELNELVLVFSTHGNLAAEGLDAEDPRREQLLRIQEASRRAAELARRLRAIGASRIARLEQVDLNDVVERFVALVRRALPRAVELDFIPGHQLGTVTADPSLLEQVLLNLCINSRDAMPRGGRIIVETENVLVNGKYQESHPWAKPGRYVLLTVSDDGVGMPAEVRDHAFEPFFTTKAPGRGAGLGLATVYGIVQLHGGMIHLYSEVEKGTTFKIYLPAVSRRADSVGTKLEGAVTGGTETILVAEDRDDVRNLVAKLLGRVGYRVLLARDGLDAVRVYGENVQEIALVLMDVAMPNLDGREAAERIRALNPDARILFTSGSTERSLAAAELLPLVEKPYEPDAFLRLVRKLLDD
ncbi:MAG TPA: ATP-binding protein [Polyangiaceae bacterium]|nr:ATP-binding protein [Polyangiaceae bacterium]